jgi:hypothetical protein
MARRQYAGGAVETTISGTILSSGGGSVDLVSSAGWPDGTTGPFAVVVNPGQANEEKILAATRTGVTVTYSASGRGYDGTAASTHSSSAVIYPIGTAIDFDEANAHVNSTAAAHTAAAVTFAPGGAVTSTTVQAAVAEVSTKYVAADAALQTTATANSGRLTTIETAGWAGPTVLAANAVTTAKIADLAVTPAKIAVSTGIWSNGSTQTCAGGGALTAFAWTAETRDDLNLAVPSFTSFTLTAGVWAVEVLLNSSAAPGDASVRMVVNGNAEDRKVSTISYGTFRHTYVFPLTASAACAVNYANAGTAVNVLNATLTIMKLGTI